MFQDVITYLHTFGALHECFVNASSPVQYQILINVDKHPTRDHQGLYNTPKGFKDAKIISKVEDNLITNYIDKILQRRGVQNTKGKKVFIEINVAHRPRDSLPYLLVFPLGENVWHLDKGGGGSTYTPSRFYRYKLFDIYTEF